VDFGMVKGIDRVLRAYKRQQWASQATGLSANWGSKMARTCFQ
jgi:hypothetical protein